jgi:hypothetical protein
MTSILVAAAISGMVAGTREAHAGAQALGASSDGTLGDKNKCAGQNECKGLGGCKTDKHACAGQNDCKGQGGCSHRPR